MPVLKFLEIHVQHLTEKDLRLLERYDPYMPSPANAVSAHPYQWGADVSATFLFRDDPETCGQRMRNIRNEGFSPFFLNALRVAHAMNCRRLRVDVDGDHEPGLPVVHGHYIHRDCRRPDVADLGHKFGLSLSDDGGLDTVPGCVDRTEAINRLFDQASYGDVTALRALKETKRYAPGLYESLADTHRPSVLLQDDDATMAAPGIGA